MSQPDRQIEVQLGHLCNNRCVFCVSGQLSEQHRAPQLPEAPISRQLAKARAEGATKITFLGGEPTLQRSFLPLLAYAVELDFDEIVIFTNGVMTPRKSFRERAMAVLAGLGPDMARRVVWRFSLQGGDREAHDRTTCNPGAWDRIQKSMGLIAEQGGRISGNMCVVSQNFASVAALAEVAQRHGLENLHLDMFRPRDSGDRTREYLRGLMARYTEMLPAFRALVTDCDDRLGSDYDVNIGNMPYCVAPDLAHKMHHDGEFTVTVAASGRGTTQEGFDKYEDKRCDKHQMPVCAGCVFVERCGGVFDLYAEFHGEGEFATVTAEQLWQQDRAGHHFVLLAQAAIEAWAAATPARRVLRVDERAGSIEVELGVPDGSWRMQLGAAARDVDLGWATVAGTRVAAALLGPMPPGEGAVQALADALGALDQQLGGSGQLTGSDGLTAAWQRATAATRVQDAAAQRLRNNALALARGLQGLELGGLRQRTMARSEDGRWLDVTFRRGSETLVLSIGLVAEGQGGRPPLRHRAEGLKPDALAAFNRALGHHLRARQRPQAPA